MKLCLFCSQHGTLVGPLATILNALQRRCKRSGNSCSVEYEKWNKVIKDLEENAEREEQCVRCNKP